MRGLGSQRDPGLMLGGVVSVGDKGISGGDSSKGGLHGMNLRLDGAILNLKGVNQGVRMTAGVAGRELQAAHPLSTAFISRRRTMGQQAGGKDQCKAAFMHVNQAMKPSESLTQVCSGMKVWKVMKDYDYFCKF